MPASPRKLIIPDGADCVVHAVSRCVRRAWLCGRDPYTGKDYEHRRDWVRDRVRELAGVFAVEVCAYAIMSIPQPFRALVPSSGRAWAR